MPKIPMHLLDVHKERRKLTKELHSIGPFIRGSILDAQQSKSFPTSEKFNSLNKLN